MNSTNILATIFLAIILFIILMLMDFSSNPNDNFPIHVKIIGALAYGAWITLWFNKGNLCEKDNEKQMFDYVWLAGAAGLIFVSVGAVFQEGNGIPFQ